MSVKPTKRDAFYMKDDKILLEDLPLHWQVGVVIFSAIVLFITLPLYAPFMVKLATYILSPWHP